MSLNLLPSPRRMSIHEGSAQLPEQAVILIPSAQLFTEAQMAQFTLSALAGLDWPIVAGSSSQHHGLTLTIDPALPAQGYGLTIRAEQISIIGGDAAGVFYGLSTLRQIIEQQGAQITQLHIEDYPDFPVRGVMIDISRNKVPTMATLYALIEELAGWKINQIQLYMEHSFAYSQHQTAWREASPMSGEEILELDAFCKTLHIDLVPNQNSLGHMEHWLKHAEYKHLAECPDGFIGDFGDHMGERRPATSLNPIDPRSIEFMSGLYDELLPHFTSGLFNVGGDEPWEMGLCQSKEAVEQHGRGRVYVDHLLKLHELASKHGRRMMFWADVIVKYPELLAEFPKDVIALEWGYSADHPYSVHSPLFAESGLEFYVVPGTSSWNSLAGRSDNTLANIRDAAENGLKYGASGLLITDWGDRGHWQPLPVSYLGYVYGAGVAWGLENNAEMDIRAALSQHAFSDTTGIMGKIVYDLGKLYALPGFSYPNGSLLFFLLQLNHKDLSAFIRNLDEHVVKDRFFGLNADSLREALSQIEAALKQLKDSRMQRPDAALIVEEYMQVAALLRHACLRGLFLLGEGETSVGELLSDLEALIPQQRLIWLARNRPGGLKDSISRFEPVLRDYRAQAGDTPSYL